MSSSGIGFDTGPRSAPSRHPGYFYVEPRPDAGLVRPQFDVGEFLNNSVRCGRCRAGPWRVAEAADFHRRLKSRPTLAGELQGPLQDSLQEGIDALILITDLVGFPGKAGNALEAGQDDLAQAVGVGVFHLFFVDFRKLGGVLLRTGRVPERVDGKDTGRRDFGEKGTLLGKRLLDGSAERGVI